MIPGVRRLQSGMTSVTISRTDLGEYIATNEAGSQLAFGEGEDQFSAVELLLVALGGCTGIDVDYLTARRSEPTAFEITVSTGDDGTWSYDETTTLLIPDRDEPFLHTDMHHLTKVGEPTPNPLAR